MAIQINRKNVKSIQIGQDNVKEVWIGDKLVWTACYKLKIELMDDWNRGIKYFTLFVNNEKFFEVDGSNIDKEYNFEIPKDSIVRYYLELEDHFSATTEQTFVMDQDYYLTIGVTELPYRLTIIAPDGVDRVYIYYKEYEWSDWQQVLAQEIELKKNSLYYIQPYAAPGYGIIWNDEYGSVDNPKVLTEDTIVNVLVEYVTYYALIWASQYGSPVTFSSLIVDINGEKTYLYDTESYNVTYGSDDVVKVTGHVASGGYYDYNWTGSKTPEIDYSTNAITLPYETGELEIIFKD